MVPHSRPCLIDIGTVRPVPSRELSAPYGERGRGFDCLGSGPAGMIAGERRMLPVVRVAIVVHAISSLVAVVI